MKEFKPNEVTRAERKLQTEVNRAFGRDSSGDPQVVVMLIDRSRYEPFSYMPVPYRHLDGKGQELAAGQVDPEVAMERLTALQVNLGLASRAVDIEMRYERHSQDKRRFAASPAGKRLLAAHRRGEHTRTSDIDCPICQGTVAAEAR